MTKTTVCIFGIGEAGSAIASDLVEGGAHVVAFDPAEVPTPRGVSRADSPSAAVEGSSLVMAVIAARDARAALAQAVDDLPWGALYADLSTALPALKVELAESVAARAIRFVDVAIMAPVPGRGLSTPCLASGPGASEYAELINQLGGVVDAIDTVPGVAATRKLLRSVVTKGLTAVVLEAMAAAEAADLESWLWEHLAEFMDEADRSTLDRLFSGTAVHADRRVAEMESARALLEDLHIEPVMTESTGRTLQMVRSGLIHLPEI